MLQTIKNQLKRPFNLAAAHFGAHTKAAAQPTLWILMYHRILPVGHPDYSIEEPGMLVEPETLKWQLQQLSQFFTFISLTEWLSRSKNGQPLPSKACAVTFDDGWLDNYHFALPILKQLEVPATLFAVSDLVGTSMSFWPNQIQILLKEANQPKEQQKILQHFDLPVISCSNNEEISNVISQLKNYDDDWVLNKLHQIDSRLLRDNEKPPALMNWEQLNDFASQPLLSVGSHTRRHIRLNNQISNDVLQNEVVESKAHLEKQLERPIELFCYPNGEYSSAAKSLVNQHYLGAVTTQYGINNANSDSSALNRIGLHQDISHTDTQLLARMSNWLNQ